jgi:hypothetical protein
MISSRNLDFSVISVLQDSLQTNQPFLFCIDKIPSGIRAPTLTVGEFMYQAETIKSLIKSLRSANMPWQKIADTLNDRGFTRPSGLKWCSASTWAVGKEIGIVGQKEGKARNRLIEDERILVIEDLLSSNASDKTKILLLSKYLH